MVVPQPCRCAAPNRDCFRAGTPMNGRLWQLCSGTNCAPTLSLQYRAIWDGISPDDLLAPVPGEPPASPGAAAANLCVHLGEQLTGPDGEPVTQVCGSCPAGKTRLKVFACNHPL